MKRYIPVLFMAALCLTGYSRKTANDYYNELDSADRKLLVTALSLAEQGMAEASLTDLDYLVKKYPKNYMVQYERLTSVYALKRYKDVLKSEKYLLKHKDADALSYQLIGNTYDLTGKRKKAEKVYKAGLKKFPASGALYLELGNLYMVDRDYNKALGLYSDGIVAQPDFASNYFRAAQLLLASREGRVWGLVYAEAAILLAPRNIDRKTKMSDGIVECLKESITFGADSVQALAVKLTPASYMSVDHKTGVVYLAFPGIYELAVLRTLTNYVADKIPFDFSLPELIDLRKGVVENYYEYTDNLYGNSMYLLEYHKKVIDAGHWDAYNYWIFAQTYPEEARKWFKANNEKLNAFSAWYDNNPFRPGDGRTVDERQIFNNYPQIDMMKAVEIQSALLPKLDVEQ